MTILYVNGCSQTAGAEIVSPGIVDTQTNPHNDNRKLSWAGQIHNNLFKNWEYVNAAYSGSNNESIALNTINDIEQLTPSQRYDVRVLIGWTYPGRYQFEVPKDFGCYKQKAKFFAGYGLSNDLKEIPYADELWNGINGIHTPMDDYKTFIRDYTLLSSYLYTNNIRYCMLHFNWHPKTVNTDNRYTHMYNRYVHDDNFIYKYNDSVTWLHNNNYIDTEDGRTGHYTQQAHAEYSKFISKEVLACLQ